MEKEKYIKIEKEIKDVDEKKGIVTMYVNAFDNEDSDGDISVKGSFKKTIKENFKRLRHLLNHNGDWLLGLPLEMIEDDFGLMAISQMNMEKTIAQDVFSDYKLFAEHGRTLEHSVKLQVIKRDPKDERRVLEWLLWEYSTLTGKWGANPETPMINIKSLSDLELMINEGNYSNEKSKYILELYDKLKSLLQPGSTQNEPLPTETLSQTFLKNIRI